jgi:hypothetical protein
VVRAGTPSNFAYPLATINATVGEAIPTDIPSVTGTVDAFRIAPALPAGLSLDGATGTISGTPAGVAPQQGYVVTATNSNGSTDTIVTISVAQAKNTLLELGHSQAIQTLRLAGGHMLSADSSAHWNLWDYPSGALLASGDGMVPYKNCNYAHYGAPYCPNSLPTRYTNVIDMAGQIFVVAVSNGLEIHAQSDGRLISLIVFRGLDLFGPDPVDPEFNTQVVNWWQLASDGSYISIGSASGIFLYSPQGQLILFKAGDYSLASTVNSPSPLTFSAPYAVRVAQGPAGAKVIESISIAEGTSTISPPFSGDFSSWFVDGSRFLTDETQDVTNGPPPNSAIVYSNTGVQEAAVILPALAGLGGQGNWIWTYGEDSLVIYPIGSESPALSWNGGGNSRNASTITSSASTLGFVSYDVLATPSGAVTGFKYKFNVVDLSGPNPVKTDYVFPVPYPGASPSYAAISASQWVAGNDYGVILDGSSLPNTPRYFGYGDAWSIAGASNTFAVSTADGKIRVFDLYSQTLKQTIDFLSGKIALSADGHVLGSSANPSPIPLLDIDIPYDRTLNIYSLPSGTVTSSFPYSQVGFNYINLMDFVLSSSGTALERSTLVCQDRSCTPSRQVTDIKGGTVIWSDTPGAYLDDIPPVLLSPNGTLIAATQNVAPHPGPNPTTSILKDTVGGIATVPGIAVGWIDDDRLLVNDNRRDENGFLHYLGCSIYSATGALLASPPLPELKNIQLVAVDTVYDPSRNSIYSLTTGQPVWTGTYPISANPFTVTGVGDIAGSSVVYKSGPKVVRETF